MLAQIMEYVLSIAAIARGWSGYLATLCNQVCLPLHPAQLSA
jgi:hypothetical protein